MYNKSCNLDSDSTLNRRAMLYHLSIPHAIFFIGLLGHFSSCSSSLCIIVLKSIPQLTNEDFFSNITVIKSGKKKKPNNFFTIFNNPVYIKISTKKFHLLHFVVAFLFNDYFLCSSLFILHHILLEKTNYFSCRISYILNLVVCFFKVAFNLFF